MCVCVCVCGNKSIGSWYILLSFHSLFLQLVHFGSVFLKLSIASHKAISMGYSVRIALPCSGLLYTVWITLWKTKHISDLAGTHGVTVFIIGNGPGGLSSNNWIRLFVFHMVLNVFFQLFLLQLRVNSRADWAL